MTAIKEFETWATECGFDITKWKNGVYKISATTLIFSMWQEKQREIDALKHKLAVTDDGFRAAEALLKSLSSENAALKAEVERLRGLLHDLPPLCEIERLQRNATELQKDAERYRALPSLGWYVGPPGYRNYAFSKKVLDEGVDAAMKETK